MATNSKHTPTPWNYKQAYANGAGAFIGPDGKGIACITSSTKRDNNAANAAHIVRCVNAHDELVAALRALLKAHGERTSWASESLWDAARAALAKAEE